MERPKLKREWIGRKVQLLRALRTRTGICFPEGSIMEVIGNKGSLSLRLPDPAPPGQREGRRIRRVSEADVRLLPREAHS